MTITCQYSTTRRTLSCTLVLITASLLTVPLLARGDTAEFPHLLQQIGDSTRRLHLISEIVQGGHKIQVEEFLDLNTYSQLIQLKWHEQTSPQASTKLTTHKINVLLLNGKDKSVLYEYRPYECASIALDGQNHLDGDSTWKAFDLPAAGNSNTPTEEQAGALLAKSIVSTALDSPYLVRMAGKEQQGEEGSKWVSGIAGLWLAAQFAINGEHPEHPEQSIAGKVMVKEGAWRFYRSAGLVVQYYMQRETNGPARHREFERPDLIIVRHNSQPEDQQQTINVFQFELDYSDQLAQNLFTLPIGFDCPANSLLNVKGLYFQSDQRSLLMQFELVASRTRSSSSQALTSPVDVRTIELAQVRHPLDASSRLTMFSSREDHYKAIQDHSFKLEYKLLQVPGSTTSETQCFVEHLQYDRDDGKGERATAATNSNQIRFNANKLQLELSEFHLDFLLGLSRAATDTDAPADLAKMRLLNSFDLSDTQSELVFESIVPSEHLDMLTDLTGTHSEFQMRVVRVYEQQRVKSALDSTRIRRGSLRLVRVLLLVFDVAHSEKLAEVRLNLVEDQQLLNWTQRAQLFDLTRCRNLDEESMQLVVRYPAEPELLAYVNEHSSLLLERFYHSSVDWLPSPTTKKVGLAAQQEPTEPDELLEKRRMGASLNYMRVPRAELRGAPGGDLELHLTILEAISPLDSFEKISDATFTTTSGNSILEEDVDFEQPLLVSSVRACARLCQQFGCKVFAYEPSRECRMSHLELEDRDRLDSKRQEESSEKRSQKESGSQRPRRVRLVSLPLSELYFEPEHLRARAGPSEATLAELSSYIAHASYDLDGSQGDAAKDQTDRDSVTSSREKRQATPERMPLFAFDFIDRSSGAKSEYATPTMRLLVPSEINIRYLPLVLNFARDGPQMERVSRSFSVRYTGKAYKLTALDKQVDGEFPIGLVDENERLFRDAANRVYYNLKRAVSVSQDNCALLCHNIEEFNSQTGGEQICISFSYSLGDEQCLLLVKTDFAFLQVQSAGDVRELAREGDRVLELAPVGDGGFSLEQLMTKSMGSIIAFRNYLTDFQGPLKISDLVSGYRSTHLIEEEYLKRGLEIEWLEALVVESYGGESETREDIREQCAQKCLERNRAGAKRADSSQDELCLALDHCASSTPLEQKDGQSASPTHHHKQVCRLLLIRGERMRTNREHVQPIRALRARLTRPLNPTDSNKDGAIQSANSCNRYILSHLYEFNHLSQRQLLTTTGSGALLDKLEKSSETSYDSNLDTCALECSLRTPADCLMFEFCQSVKVTGSGEQSLERNCTMLRRTDLAVARAGGGQSSGNKLAKYEMSVTTFHKDCHVYVRRQFNSIEQALSDEALEKLLPKYGPGSREFAHTPLAIGFLILYLLAMAGLAGFIVHLNRQQKSSSANRQDVAIMMAEINKRLETRP